MKKFLFCSSAMGLIVIYVLIIVFAYLLLKLVPIDLRVSTDIIGYFIYLLWLLALGIYLQKDFNFHSKLKRGLFYLSAIGLAGIYFNMYKQIIPDKDWGLIIAIGSFSQIYLCYYVSILIVSSINKKRIDFSDCLGTFCYLWILPLGVLWIQPKIHKIYKLETE